jgi:hypothetical protein
MTCWLTSSASPSPYGQHKFKNKKTKGKMTNKKLKIATRFDFYSRQKGTFLHFNLYFLFLTFNL